MVVNFDGVFFDFCWLYVVGILLLEIVKLMDVIKKFLYMGIDQCVLGNWIGDIGVVIQYYIEDENGYGDVKEFVGYGIGFMMYEDLMVFYYGEVGYGLCLCKGMMIMVELMINIGIW